MKRFFLAFMLFPLAAFAGIRDWDYTPFIKYSGEYPGDMIKQGANFDLLLNLWQEPKSMEELKKVGFDFAAVDTTLLKTQGMIYSNQGIYYSAIPFIDSLATYKINDLAKQIAANIINNTGLERERFFEVLDSAGLRQSAFPVVHSFIFDDIIWDKIGVSQEKSTICRTDSMTWSGLYYFYRPETSEVYGTNGVRLSDNHRFKFAWGNPSNAYLCTVFYTSSIIPAVRNILNGENLTEEMLQDCKKYGVIGDDNHFNIPILDGKDSISIAADEWAKSAAREFNNQFDGDSLMKTMGWRGKYNEGALKIMLYHVVLTEIADLLDKSGILPVPSVLTSDIPSDKSLTATIAYITVK